MPRFRTPEAVQMAATISESWDLIHRARVALGEIRHSVPATRREVESAYLSLGHLDRENTAAPAAASPGAREHDVRELVTHIERCRALLRGVKDTVHKALLADMVRYLEGRLKTETVGVSPDRAVYSGQRRDAANPAGTAA